MHYSDGTEAKLGDVVETEHQPGSTAPDFIGVLVFGKASPSTCNGQLEAVLMRTHSDLGVGPWMEFQGIYQQCFTIKESHKIA